MEKHRVAIIEDEKHGVDILSHFLKTYCPSVEIVGTAGDLTSAQQLIKVESIDLIFLDIMLEDGTGFDLLDLVQERGNTQVVFVTAYNEYAIKAFKYSALDYILKPIEIGEIVAAIEKLSERKNISELEEQLSILKNELKSTNNKDKVIAISMIDKIEMVKLNELLYIEADGKYSKFYLTTGNTILSSKNIGEYEKLFSDSSEPSTILRVHNSYLVNLDFVKSIKSKNGAFCEMKNDQLVPISRRRLTEVRALILEKK